MSRTKPSRTQVYFPKKYFQDRNQADTKTLKRNADSGSNVEKQKSNQKLSLKSEYFSSSSPALSHLRKTKIGPFYYVVPKISKKENIYTWSELHVAPSRIPTAGMGLFATTFLPKFTVIPYLGDVIDFRSTSLSFTKFEELDTKDKRRYFLLQRSLGVYVDGYSSRHTPNKKLSISGYINEATSPICPNTLLYKSYFVTTQDIFPGEELYTDYGPFYYSSYSDQKPTNCRVRPLGKKNRVLLPISEYKKRFNIQERIWKGIEGYKKWLAFRPRS